MVRGQRLGLIQRAFLGRQTQIKSPDQTPLFSSLLFSPLALLLPIQSRSPLTREDLQGAELATEGGPGHTGTPGMPTQLGEGRTEERKQTVSSTLGRERGTRWGLEGPWETFLDPASLPSSLLHWLISSSSLSSPGSTAFPPFLSSHHPQLPASVYPPKTAAFSWEQNSWQQGEGLGAPEGFPLHPSAVSEVCCGYPLSTRHHSPCLTART